MWDTVNGRKIASYPGHIGQVQVLAWSPDSRRIAIAGTYGTVQVWNVVTGKNIVRYQGLSQTASLTWSLDGKLIAATSENNTVQVLQAT